MGKFWLIVCVAGFLVCFGCSGDESSATPEVDAGGLSIVA